MTFGQQGQAFGVFFGWGSRSWQRCFGWANKVYGCWTAV